MIIPILLMAAIAIYYRIKWQRAHETLSIVIYGVLKNKITVKDNVIEIDGKDMK